MTKNRVTLLGEGPFRLTVDQPSAFAVVALDGPRSPSPARARGASRREGAPECALTKPVRRRDGGFSGESYLATVASARVRTGWWRGYAPGPWIPRPSTSRFPT